MKPEPRLRRRPSDAATQLLKAPVADPVIAGVLGETPPAKRSVSELTKLTIRLDRELLGRVRAAYVLDGLPAGHTSLSGWVASVLADRVARVEADRGEPLTPIGVDRIPKGRLS